MGLALRMIPGIGLLAISVQAQNPSLPSQWTQQRWTGISGVSISNLTDSPAFYSLPSVTQAIGSSYTQLGDNYGARTRGYITPAISGLYTFWVSGDDETRLSISPDSSKWTARAIASSATWTALNSFDESFSQRSVSRYLLAGQTYYIELLHKEGGGFDHASVSWALQETNSSVETNWAAMANGGIASQSSTYGSYPASNAIDENPATFSHTNNVAASSLTADFRQDRLISRVELINRQDACRNRLSNFRVTVEDAAGTILAEKCYYETTGSVGASETWTLPATIAARRVKVQFLGLSRDNSCYLSLGELRAFGPGTLQRNWSHEAGATASQNTAFSSNYPASNAIDGNTATFNHTADSPSSALITDLGTDRLIDTVELINRQDANCQNRLSNFRVSILDAANAVLLSQDYYPSIGNVRGALRWELPTAVSGRKVKVELLGLNRAGNNYLHIAEINVWGRQSAGIAQRGQRTLIPADVMSGYDPALTDDKDDDSMPDAMELAYGLNPADPSDAVGDFDNDNINNLTEIRANSDPSVKSSVPGVLVDEIWHNIPGDNLTAAGYKAAFTHDPDFIANITTTQAFAHGEQYVRRVRGFITAPVTGAYQFWGAADSDVDMFLSTSASKFDRALILDNKVLSWGENYDIDLSQKSRLVTLTAGQKYYFEMWHKEGIGGSMVSVAWKPPGGTRQLIPTPYLSSYSGEANDQDDDYLKDDYELANGLSIIEDGKSPGSTDGLYGDRDNDGLTNGEEQKLNTKSNLADSDGDGVSDYDEANFFDSATLANDIGPFTPVATLTGDAYTANFGEWIKTGGKALQNCRRGSVTYPVTVTASGIHALKFAITSVADGAKSEQYEFDLKINGKRIAYKTLNILPNGSATLAVLSPWLNAGETYNLELFVDNSYNFRRVSIDSLQILTAGGTDSNANGTPDWVDIRMHATNGFDSTAILSKTSPATVEGNAKYFDLINTNGISVKQAPNGRFFTEVSLTSGSASTLNFSFENGAVSQAATAQWLPSNLLQESAITLRQGDSLLLTAYQNAENASLESYTLTTNGQTYDQTADQPSQVIFNTPGTTTIQLAHTGTDALVTNRTIAVTVLPKVNIESPLCVVGYPRLWTHPALPAGATLQFDNQTTRWQESAGNAYTIATFIPTGQPILARSSTGHILGCSLVNSVSIRSSDLTGNIRVGLLGVNQLIDMPVVAYGNLVDVKVRCEIIIGGVTYFDGSTIKDITSVNFLENDTHVLQFVKTVGAHSNCHRFRVYQGINQVSLIY